MKRKALREARGDKTLKEVATAIGISTSALCMYENTNRKPRDDIKVKIATYYKMSVGTLFFDEEVQNN